MTAEPYISTRKYIKWGDNPAGENTETVVLTTPRKYYTDLRIFLSSSPPDTQSTPSLPLSRLEWAFAGTSTSTPATSTAPAHTVWTHWVDSKTTDEVKDEGDMHPQADNSTLEYGRMANPATGKEEDYEECWIDVPAVKPSSAGEKAGFTINLEDEGKDVKGVAVRIGDFVQGVVRRGDKIGAERWELSEEQGWNIVVRIGEHLGLSPARWSGVKWKVGDSITSEGGEDWRVLEVFEWK